MEPTLGTFILVMTIMVQQFANHPKTVSSSVMPRVFTTLEQCERVGEKNIKRLNEKNDKPYGTEWTFDCINTSTLGSFE